jgi:hypothetical protein
MKIKSNYKDYYDNVAYRFGGGDPKIVYVRPHKLIDIPDMEKEIKRTGHFQHRFKSKSIENITILYDRNNSEENLRYGISKEETDIRGIIIGEYFFCQIKRVGDENYRLVRESDLRNTPNPRKHAYCFKPEILKIDEFINYKDSTLLDICKNVALPVFSFQICKFNNRGSYHFEINELIPNLGKVGVASFISDVDIYQYLSYLIGNKMKDCPDTMPPIIVSDKDKIIGHGFDYKTSFRGKIIKEDVK